MTPLRAGILALVALAPLAPQDAPWPLEEPDPAVDISAPRLDVEGHECLECHAEVVREWSVTTHALAWADEDYHRYLEDVRRKEGCYACHAPQPLLADGESPPRRPDTRADDRHDGVNCRTCHLGPDGTWLGATGAETDAHGTAASPHLADANELCMSCHSTTIGPVVGLGRDFRRAKMAERGRSCVGCHMRPRELPEDAPEDARPGRSHALQTPRDPAFLRRAFHLRHVSRDGESVLVIENQAGHRVPGLEGREIRFEVSGQGASAQRTLDTRAHLRVDGSIEVPLSAAAETLRVRGLHKDPRAVDEIEFLDESLERE